MLQRNAQSSDLNSINQLIRQSKGYWGYSNTFLDAFMSQWGITNTYINTNEVILFEQQGDLIGLFAFKINDDRAPELDLLFVHPTHIGNGIGKTLWQQALVHASSKKWLEFKIISDPHAEQFYEHMGAKTIGTYESFPGRFVPVMRVELA